MQTPRIFIAYAPRAGLRCAVAYLVSPRDAYGWFTAAGDGAMSNAYFVLEDYFTAHGTRRVIVPEGDLYAGAIEDARCHELVRLHDLMEHEWLFHRSDPEAAAEIAAYAGAELFSGDTGVRFARLNRLSKLHLPWTYYSPAFEDGVLESLGPSALHGDAPSAPRSALTRQTAQRATQS